MGVQGAPQLCPGVILVGPGGGGPGDSAPQGENEAGRGVPFRGRAGAPVLTRPAWSLPPARFAVRLVPWEPNLRRLFGCRRVGGRGIPHRGKPAPGGPTARAVGVFPGRSLDLGLAAMPVHLRCGILPMLLRIPLVPVSGLDQMVRQGPRHHRAGPAVAPGSGVCGLGLVFAVVAMPRPVMMLSRPRAVHGAT